MIEEFRRSTPKGNRRSFQPRRPRRTGRSTPPANTPRRRPCSSTGSCANRPRRNSSSAPAARPWTPPPSKWSRRCRKAPPRPRRRVDGAGYELADDDERVEIHCEGTGPQRLTLSLAANERVALDPGGRVLDRRTVLFVPPTT